MIEEITAHGALLAIILRRGFSDPGIRFFTPPEFSQQLAFMRHPPGREIPPHVHNPVPRQVQFTQEVLVIRRGRLRVDFYDEERVYRESRILEAGDTILLTAGGHGFEVLDEVEMIEVKQGPYSGEQDKTRFPSVDRHLVRFGRGTNGDETGD